MHAFKSFDTFTFNEVGWIKACKTLGITLMGQQDVVDLYTPVSAYAYRTRRKQNAPMLLPCTATALKDQFQNFLKAEIIQFTRSTLQ